MGPERKEPTMRRRVAAEAAPVEEGLQAPEGAMMAGPVDDQGDPIDHDDLAPFDDAETGGGDA
jgi:hypothetical protein